MAQGCRNFGRDFLTAEGRRIHWRMYFERHRMTALLALPKVRVGVPPRPRRPSVPKMTRESSDSGTIAKNTIYDSGTCGASLAWGIGWNWLELACNRLPSARNRPEPAAIGNEWVGIGKRHVGSRQHPCFQQACRGPDRVQHVERRIRRSPVRDDEKKRSGSMQRRIPL